MGLTETMKCRASSPCLNCVGWQDMSLTEGRASSPCLDCVGWQDMRLVSGRASSPCLNCMGWQDTSLTVAKEDRASFHKPQTYGDRTRAHLACYNNIKWS